MITLPDNNNIIININFHLVAAIYLKSKMLLNGQRSNKQVFLLDICWQGINLKANGMSIHFHCSSNLDLSNVAMC